jgi:hypothetical protein
MGPSLVRLLGESGVKLTIALYDRVVEGIGELY